MVLRALIRLRDHQISDYVMKRPKRGRLLKKQFFDLVLPPMRLLLEGSAAVYTVFIVVVVFISITGWCNGIECYSWFSEHKSLMSFRKIVPSGKNSSTENCIATGKETRWRLHRCAFLGRCCGSQSWSHHAEVDRRHIHGHCTSAIIICRHIRFLSVLSY